MISITRIDPLAGIPDVDPNAPGRGILSIETCADWADVSAKLAARDIPFTASQLSEFSAERPADTITFQHLEFLNAGVAAYTCNVNYVIDPRADEVSS